MWSVCGRACVWFVVCFVFDLWCFVVCVCGVFVVVLVVVVWSVCGLGCGWFVLLGSVVDSRILPSPILF